MSRTRCSHEVSLCVLYSAICAQISQVKMKVLVQLRVRSSLVDSFGRCLYYRIVWKSFIKKHRLLQSSCVRAFEPYFEHFSIVQLEQIQESFDFFGVS
jgi:hypothetical protein